MTKCNREYLTFEEYDCSGCNGKGFFDDLVTLTMCDLCHGLGFYMDACCTEHAEEYELDLYHQSQLMEPDHE